MIFIRIIKIWKTRQADPAILEDDPSGSCPNILFAARPVTLLPSGGEVKPSERGGGVVGGRAIAADPKIVFKQTPDGLKQQRGFHTTNI